MKSIFKFINLSLIAAGFAFLAAPLSAGTLSQEMEAKADLIARFLQSDNLSEVSMQPISAPGKMTGINAIGIELEKHLSAHEHKVTLDSRAGISIAIKVKFSKDNRGNPEGLDFNISLQDDSGDTLVDFVGKFDGKFSDKKGKKGFNKEGVTHAKIDNPDDVQQILSVPVETHDVNLEFDMSPDGDNGKLGKAHKHKEIKEAYDNPKNNTFIQNGRVSSSPSRKFEIQLVKTDSNDARPDPSTYQPIPVSIDGGFAFANLNPGDNVGIKIFNNSSERIAVDATLDGISSFNFAPKVTPYYAISQHKEMLLRGFLKSYDAASKKASYTHFKIVQFEDTVWNQARKKGQAPGSEAFGSIAVHFHRELPGPPPKDRGGPGFGEGNKFTQQMNSTKMHVGTILETIVIQYQKP